MYIRYIRKESNSKNDNQINIHVINKPYKINNTRFLQIDRQYFSKIIIRLSQDSQPTKKIDNVELNIHDVDIYNHLNSKYKKFRCILDKFPKPEDLLYKYKYKFNSPNNQQLFNIINDAVLDGKYGILGPSLSIQNNNDKKKVHANKCLIEFIDSIGVNYKKQLLIYGYLRQEPKFYKRSKDINETIYHYSSDMLSPSFFSNCNKYIKNNDENNSNTEDTTCSLSDSFSKCTIL